MFLLHPVIRSANTEEITMKFTKQYSSILSSLLLTEVVRSAVVGTYNISGTIQGTLNDIYSSGRSLAPTRNLPDSHYELMIPEDSHNCVPTGCCARKLDSLRTECALLIPFGAAALSYMLAYGVSKYVSATPSTCSSTVTTSKTLVMVAFTTSTGTITDTTTFNRITFTTALSTVYTPSVVFTTSTVTNVITSTPTSYTLISSTVPVTVAVTSVICQGRRSIEEDEIHEAEKDDYTVQNPRDLNEHFRTN